MWSRVGFNHRMYQCKVDVNIPNAIKTYRRCWLHELDRNLSLFWWYSVALDVLVVIQRIILGNFHVGFGLCPGPTSRTKILKKKKIRGKQKIYFCK